ncbi:hypothetical protein B0H12DRAFT_1326449 [Mycena haematopus]|nr:hypothetical protein B0H12DRAFT_1326449 [Mycena haematopus]
MTRLDGGGTRRARPTMTTTSLHAPQAHSMRGQPHIPPAIVTARSSIPDCLQSPNPRPARGTFRDPDSLIRRTAISSHLPRIHPSISTTPRYLFSPKPKPISPLAFVGRGRPAPTPSAPLPLPIPTTSPHLPLPLHTPRPHPPPAPRHPLLSPQPDPSRPVPPDPDPDPAPPSSRVRRTPPDPAPPAPKCDSSGGGGGGGGGTSSGGGPSLFGL